MMKFLFTLALLLGLSACSSVQSTPAQALLEHSWRALEIEGTPVTGDNHQAEPHLVLAAENRTHGSDGCNRFSGSYEIAASALRFGRMASTRMACLPPLDLVSRDFSVALAATTGYRIQGRQLLLLDDAGRVRMRLEATALK